MIELKFFLTCFVICMFQVGCSQIKFQKLYHHADSASSMMCCDSKATPDGGYVFTGLVSEGNGSVTDVYHPFIQKVNCKGEAEWLHAFGSTQSTDNIGSRVIVT